MEYEADENADDEGLVNRSVRQKFTRSMPSNNVEGLSESQYKARWQAEHGFSRKYKKRYLKDLTPEEREDIVRLHEEEQIMQKDLAQRFKVSKHIVWRLVND